MHKPCELPATRREVKRTLPLSNTNIKTHSQPSLNSKPCLTLLRKWNHQHLTLTIQLDWHAHAHNQSLALLLPPFLYLPDSPTQLNDVASVEPQGDASLVSDKGKGKAAAAPVGESTSFLCSSYFIFQILNLASHSETRSHSILRATPLSLFYY